MKKARHLLTVMCILMSIVFSASAAYADFYIMDPFTGNVISAENDDKTAKKDVGIITLSSGCYYDKSTRKYVYSSASHSFSCNVCNGQFVTEDVVIKPEEDSGFSLYRDGVKKEILSELTVSEPGSYAVRDISDSLVMEFTLLDGISSQAYIYDIPNVYRLSSAELNGEHLLSGGNVVDFSEEGQYEIKLYNKITEKTEALSVTIDRTAPELEIIGINDEGIARQPVSLGETEEGSSLEVYRDGVQINISGEYDLSGSYKVVYSDKAGNTNTYYFDILLYFDISAWLALSCVAALIIAAGAYMLYWKKNTRIG